MSARRRRPALALSAALLAGGLAPLASQTATWDAFLPSPVAVYDRLTATDEVVLARDGGDVGIGTRAEPPAARLDVRGGALWGGGGGLLSADQGGSIELGLAASGTPYIDFHPGDGTGRDFGGRIIQAGRDRLELAAGGTAVSVGANVGVGTTQPRYRLEVSGTLGFTGGKGPFCIFSARCPAGWKDQGHGGYIVNDLANPAAPGTGGGSCPYTELPQERYNAWWIWCRPKVCCNE